MFHHALSSSPEEQASYYFDLSKYYRIWFSDQPAVFLDMENQLRFIRLRERNATASLFFIYSRHLLSAITLTALTEFCERYRITPVDFDHELLPMLTHDADKQMYQFAKDEIQHTVNHDYGNLAAAADCVRLIVPVVERFGIYLDFDVECSLTRYHPALLEAASAVLLNVELEALSDVICLNTNSDFLAFAHDKHQPDQLAEESVRLIRNIQEGIVHRYQHTITAQTFMSKMDVSRNVLGRPVMSVFYRFYQQSRAFESIYDFRKFIEESHYEGVSLAEKRVIQATLFKLTVINMTGPGTYLALFKHLLPEGFQFFTGCVPNTKELKGYVDAFRASSFHTYANIARHIHTKNTKIHAVLQVGSLHPGVLSDLSWTVRGADFKRLRERVLISKVRKVQSIWRDTRKNRLLQKEQPPEIAFKGKNI